MPKEFPRLIVLDCDGTIVNSLTSIVNTMTEAFIKNRLEPPEPDEIRDIVGLQLSDAIKLLVSGSNLHMVDLLVNTYKEVVSKNRAAGHREDPLYPDVKDTILALIGSGCLLGVATGKSMKGLESRRLICCSGLCQRSVQSQKIQ